MDQKDIINKQCQQHSYQIIAVDLKCAKTQNEKYLCAKCLILRMEGQQIILLNELIQMIQEMKIKQKKHSIENNQTQLDYMKMLQQSLKECTNHIKETFEKTQNNIEGQIKKNENEIQIKQDSQIDIDLDQDIEKLSKYYKGNNQYELPDGSSNKEIIEQLIECVQNQIGQISNVQEYSKISESIKNIKTQFSIDISTDSDQFEKHICEQHGLEIIMVNLEFDEQQHNRLACAKCIQEFPRKYTTLEDVEQNWIKFKCHSKEMISKYIKERESKFNQAIKFITNLRDKYLETLQTIIKDLEKNKIITEDQLSPIPLFSEDIYYLDRNQFKGILEALSQKDLYRSLKLKLSQQDQLDSICYHKLKEVLENLIKYDLFTKEQIMMIESNYKVLLILSENEKEEITNSVNIQQFLENSSLLQSYLSIFEDSIQIYQKIKGQIDSLQENKQIFQFLNQKQIIIKESEQKEQLSDFQKIFQRQYQQFEMFSKKLQNMIIVYQNDNLLSQQQCEIQKLKERIQSRITMQIQIKQKLSKQLIETKNKIKKQTLDFQQLNYELEKLQQNLKQKDESEKQLMIKLEQESSKLEQMKQQSDESNQKNNTQVELLNKTITDLNLEIKNSQTKLQQKDQKINSLEQQLQNSQNQFNKLQQDHTNFQKEIKAKPNVLQDAQYQKILQTIEEKSKQTIKCSILVFCGSKDGLNHTQFWNRVYGRKNLLMVFKSNTNYICGAFSPCQWLQHLGNYVVDDTLQSFLFSQNHNQIYPIKPGNKAHAIYCNSSYGPTFGSGHDLYIPSNFNSVSSSLGSAYQCDQYGSITASTHLFGQSGVQIIECEIFEIVFK
ncbi:unnamed protein product [Paramecium sonneborni]|uniref:TLDc domain-containing protein n=1 Tax=Paramecium sonneborni TaxID=65129 RepID=A0A8S1LQ31_9CILI|nr:unnamed protein product [Paramecium sonneborni]